MWADSLASCALAGCTCSPSASSTRVTGSCASQSISRSGCRRRSSWAIATSRRACPSPIGEETNSARRRRERPRVQVRAGGLRAAGELAQEPVDLDGVAGLGAVAGAFERDERAAGGLGERGALGVRADAVGVAVDDERGAAHARGRVREGLQPAQAERRGGVGERLGVGLERPFDAVLDLLGRVRLVEHLGEEELQEPAVVLAPVVAVVHRPRVGGAAQVVLEARADRALREARRERHRRADVGDAADALGVVGGQQRRPQRAARQTGEEGLAGLGRVQDGQRVGGELGLGVGLDAGRTVRLAVAAAVERDHPEVPRQVGDLRLPVARVDDRPGRQQQDRVAPAAVDLVEEPHAVARRVALQVRVAGAVHGRTSNTRLNGVSATRRKRVKPAAVTTSRSAPRRPGHRAPARPPGTSTRACRRASRRRSRRGRRG